MSSFQQPTELAGGRRHRGAVQRIAKDYADDLPIILKCNSADSLYTGPDPVPAVTAGVEDALRLRCAAVGFTIYPGSAGRNQMYEDLRRLATDARAAGLPVVVWSYPRGSGISHEGRTAVDAAVQLLTDVMDIHRTTSAPALTGAI